MIQLVDFRFQLGTVPLLHEIAGGSFLGSMFHSGIQRTNMSGRHLWCSFFLMQNTLLVSPYIHKPDDDES